MIVYFSQRMIICVTIRYYERNTVINLNFFEVACSLTSTGISNPLVTTSFEEKNKKEREKKKVNIKHEVDAIFYVKIILIVRVIINALLTKAIRIDRIQEQITALSNRGQLPRASIHDPFK